MKQDIKYVSIGMYKQLEQENKKLKEELSKKSMETWFDKKAKNIYKKQHSMGFSDFGGYDLDNNK